MTSRAEPAPTLRPLTGAEKTRYALHRFGGGVRCQHGGHVIKPYAGIWFAVGAGAVCHDSPDTQHRPAGVPVPGACGTNPRVSGGAA